MNRYVLNQVTSKIESDPTHTYVTLRELPSNPSHKLIERIEGKTLVLTAIRNKGKHQNAYDVLIDLGVIK